MYLLYILPPKELSGADPSSLLLASIWSAPVFTWTNLIASPFSSCSPTHLSRSSGTRSSQDIFLKCRVLTFLCLTSLPAEWSPSSTAYPTNSSTTCHRSLIPALFPPPPLHILGCNCAEVLVIWGLSTALCLDTLLSGRWLYWRSIYWAPIK